MEPTIKIYIPKSIVVESNFKQHYEHNNGVPLNEGLHYFYQSGTVLGYDGKRLLPSLTEGMIHSCDTLYMDNRFRDNSFSRHIESSHKKLKGYTVRVLTPGMASTAVKLATVQDILDAVNCPEELEEELNKELLFDLIQRDTYVLLEGDYHSCKTIMARGFISEFPLVEYEELVRYSKKPLIEKSSYERLKSMIDQGKESRDMAVAILNECNWVASYPCVASLLRYLQSYKHNCKLKGNKYFQNLSLDLITQNTARFQGSINLEDKEWLADKYYLNAEPMEEYTITIKPKTK